MTDATQLAAKPELEARLKAVLDSDDLLQKLLNLDNECGGERHLKEEGQAGVHIEIAWDEEDSDLPSEIFELSRRGEQSRQPNASPANANSFFIHQPMDHTFNDSLSDSVNVMEVPGSDTSCKEPKLWLLIATNEYPGNETHYNDNNGVNVISNYRGNLYISDEETIQSLYAITRANIEASTLLDCLISLQRMNAYQFQYIKPEDSDRYTLEILEETSKLATKIVKLVSKTSD